MPRKKTPIGRYLVERAVITPEKLEAALKHQERWGHRLGEALVALGALSEEEMYRWLARFLRLPYIPLDKLLDAEKGEELRDLMSFEEVMAYKTVPIQLEKTKRKFRVVLATAEPLQMNFLDELKFRWNADILVLVAAEAAVERFAVRLYQGLEALPSDSIPAEATLDFFDYFTNWVDESPRSRLYKKK